MDVVLSVVASLYTLHVQSVLLNDHQDQHQFKPSSQNEETIPDYMLRRNEILEASLKRRNEIYTNNEIVLSQTRLGGK